MPTNETLTLYQGNDLTIRFEVTPDDPTDDLTLVSSTKFVLKPNPETADTDLSVVTLTSAVPAQMVITVQTASLIKVNAYLPASAVATARYGFWRLDCLVGTKARTAGYGPAIVTDL